MWYESPLITVPLLAISGVIIAWAVSWFNARKAKVESGSKEDLLVAELRALKIQAEITEQKRLNDIKIDEQTLAALASLSDQQKQQGTMLDETHKNTNSAKTQMEKMEMDLRSEVEALKVANRTAAEAHVIAVQAIKDISSAELKGKEAKIDELTRQLFTLGLSMPGVAQSAPQSSPPPSVIQVPAQPLIVAAP